MITITISQDFMKALNSFKEGNLAMEVMDPRIWFLEQLFINLKKNRKEDELLLNMKHL